MTQFYTKPVGSTTGLTLGFRRRIEAVKELVPIETYAADLTQLRKVGNSLRGRCPIHGGDNPHSFAIFPASGRFKCFSCGERGDVIDLCEYVEKHADTWTAVESLKLRYGVELPEKPEKWCEWQDEKTRIREAAKRHLARVYQRRLVRLYAPLVLVGGETPAEELEVLEELAAALWTRCLVLADRRVSGEE